VVESAPYPESFSRLARKPGEKPGAEAQLWVVTGDGEVLARNTPMPLPVGWKRMPRPERIHEVHATFRPFGLLPEEMITRLDSLERHYLVVRFEHHGSLWQARTLRLVVPLLAVVTSGFLSLLFSFAYLRRKSREARAVLTRMEQGDLKARFRVKQFDEVGSLMLDFNRMAMEIERLVARVEQTERTRGNLLQELSHDLRTPLMSLQAAVDTLVQCADALSEEHRDELLGVLQSELSYFSSRVSLGLGSVIMRTILELHGGHWELQSPPEGESSSGLSLRLLLPRAEPGGSEADLVTTVMRG